MQTHPVNHILIISSTRMTHCPLPCFCGKALMHTMSMFICPHLYLRCFQILETKPANSRYGEPMFSWFCQALKAAPLTPCLLLCPTVHCSLQTCSMTLSPPMLLSGLPPPWSHVTPVKSSSHGHKWLLSLNLVFLFLAHPQQWTQTHPSWSNTLFWISPSGLASVSFAGSLLPTPSPQMVISVGCLLSLLWGKALGLLVRWWGVKQSLGLLSLLQGFLTVLWHGLIRHLVKTTGLSKNNVFKWIKYTGKTT